jgi:hypothetical protein
MSSQLNVSVSHLLSQLDSAELMGVAGPPLMGSTMSDRSQFIANFFDVLRSVPSILPDVLIERHITVDSVAEDETCVICLDDKGDDPSLPWATPAGCALHRFHLKCINQWRGGSCPTCRAPLD